MHTSHSSLLILSLATALVLTPVQCFQSAQLRVRNVQKCVVPVLSAGGFGWEDPGEVFDQAVENPYKNQDLTKGEEGMKIDPARLLSPRLNGANLYLVGMMGSGKSAVGEIVAKRKLILIAL